MCRKIGRMLFTANMIVASTVIPQMVSARSIDDDNDHSMALAVQKALLADEGVPAHDIAVSVDRGIVTLDGTVHCLRALDRARRVTATVRGVRSIISRLHVPRTDIADGQIKRDIDRALANDPDIDTDAMEVIVDNGDVTVTGEASSWTRKQLCSQLIKGIRGVRSLRNDITINESHHRSDAELESLIQRRLQNSVWCYSANIDVTVQRGRADLTGTVGSVAQMDRVVNLARMVGARSVDTNNLTVDAEAHLATRRKRPPVNVSDAAISTAIRDAFQLDPRIEEEHVKVEVDDGLVTLTGTVPSLKSKEAATLDVGETVGVVGVQNLLRVQPARRIGDKELHKRVQEALLRDPDVDRLDIKVNVKNGKAYLYGNADSHFVRARAKAATAGVSGVMEVNVKGLTVQEERRIRDDEMIARDIRHELFWNPLVDSDSIQVVVSGGVATLTGKAADAHERNQATHEAYEGGAHIVYNKIELSE